MTRDLRRYTRQTNIRLLIGFILLVIIVGGILVFLFFGPAALPAFFICLAAGLLPLVIIWLILTLMDWFVKRSQ